LAQRIGLRRTADLALVEGMVLARRCGPKRGERLLELAKEYFQESSDPVGAYLADLRLGLVKVEAEKRVPVTFLADSYEACRKQAKDLSDWKALEAIVLSKPAETAQARAADKSDQTAAGAIDSLARYGRWRPCLIRSLGLMVSARERDGREAAGAAVLRRWIQQNYSVTCSAAWRTRGDGASRPYSSAIAR
jgi:hypothetical protein